MEIRHISELEIEVVRAAVDRARIADVKADALGALPLLKVVGYGSSGPSKNK
jgi:hypothetical protein